MPIAVVEYDPSWPTLFEGLRSKVSAVAQDVVLAIEHIDGYVEGKTSFIVGVLKEVGFAAMRWRRSLT